MGMNESHFVMCWGCGFATRTSSKRKANEKAEEHGHNTKIISESDMETLEKIQEGGKVVYRDEYDEALEILRDVQGGLQIGISQVQDL